MHSLRFFASPRAAMMLVFAAFGSIIGALAGSMPTVARNAGIDSVSLGLAITLSTLSTVLAMSLGGTIARHASSRRVLLLGLPALAIVLMTFLTAQATWWFFAAFAVLGFLLGLVDIFMNTEGASIEHDLRRPVFTAFHASVSLTEAIIAIAASFVSALLGTGATALLSAIMLALAWVMVLSQIKHRPLVPPRSGRLARASRRPLIMLGLAAGLIIAAETAALMWSAKLLDELAPSLTAIAGLGAAFFGLCNALLRFPGDRLRARFGDLPLMTGSLIVAIAGFAVLGFSRNFAVSAAAFAMVGLGTAVLIPCVFAVTASYVPGNRAGGLGFVSMLAGAPRIAAPWAFGWAAAAIGTNGAFGLFAIALSVALGIVVALQRRH